MAHKIVRYKISKVVKKGAEKGTKLKAEHHTVMDAAFTFDDIKNHVKSKHKGWNLEFYQMAN